MVGGWIEGWIYHFVKFGQSSGESETLPPISALMGHHKATAN